MCRGHQRCQGSLIDSRYKLPFGIDFPASAKSPDLFDPAMIPVQDGKKIPTRMAIFVVISAGIHNLERVSLFSISLAVSF